MPFLFRFVVRQFLITGYHETRHSLENCVLSSHPPNTIHSRHTVFGPLTTIAGRLRVSLGFYSMVECLSGICKALVPSLAPLHKNRSVEKNLFKDQWSRRDRSAVKVLAATTDGSSSDLEPTWQERSDSLSADLHMCALAWGRSPEEATPLTGSIFPEWMFFLYA